MLGITEAAFARRNRFATAFLLTVGFAIALFTTVLATDADAAFTITDWQLTPSSLQAGGHPNVNFHIDPDAAAGDKNGDDLKSVVIDFAAGMLANPQAVQTPCASSQFNADSCPTSTQIGSISVQYRKGGSYFTMSGSMYELTPDPESAMSFGFVVRPSGYRKIFLRSSKVQGVATVRSGLDADYGVTATINAIPRTLTTTLGFLTNVTISNVSVNLFSRSGATQNGPYLTFTPTRCNASPARATITSYANVVITRSSTVTPTGCDVVQFTPGLTISPASQQAGKSTGISATLSVPTADAPVQQSHVRNINAILPKGTRLDLVNIGAVAELCTEAQLAADACPAGSRIGDASVDVPFLPPTMIGGIFLLTRDSSITFGYVLHGARGTTAILRGSAAAIDTDADGASDSVRATFVELPQAPFSTATLKFSAELVDNPQIGCGAATASATIGGYSGASSTVTDAYEIENCVTPPNTSIDSGPSGVTGDKQPQFTFGADKPTIRFECTLDNGDFGACSSPYFTSVLTQGEHIFAVRGVNVAGADPEPATRRFVVDSIPPSLIITAPNENELLTTPEASVAFISEDGAETMCGLDGATAVFCGSPFALGELAAGDHTVVVTATDGARNSSTATRHFRVLGRGVKVIISSPEDGATLDSDTLIAVFSATSGGGSITGFECKVSNLSGSQYTTGPCESGDAFGGLSLEQHILTVTAADETGATGSASVAFNVNSRAPYGPFVQDGPVIAVASDRTPSFRLDSVDELYPDARYQCSIALTGAEPSDWHECGSGSTTWTSPDVLPDGDYSLWTRGVVGAVAGYADEWTFSVDTYDAGFSASVSTTKAGAHPNLDVEIRETAGQLRLNDLYLPSGMIGGLTAFPKCPTEVAETGVCPAANIVGSAGTDVTLAGMQIAAKLAKGPVYLTEPWVPGDSAGFMVKINPPIGGVVKAVLIPLRIMLTDNGERLEVFSDSIPVSARAWNAGDPDYSFYVSRFIMHVNGASGSPFPLMTNPSDCTPSEFSATIGDLEGNAVSAAQPFQATECDQLPFEPTITQSFGTPAAGSKTTIDTVITVPPGSSSIRGIRVLEPPALAPSFPAYGNSEDQCPSTSAPAPDSAFDAIDCPGQARVGTMTIHSPLLPVPVVGDVYLINHGVLPWFGVSIFDPVQGVYIGLTGVTDTPQVNPSCNPAMTVCPTQISVEFSNAPDVPTSLIDFDLSGPPRIGDNGNTLGGEMVKFAAKGTSSCVPNLPLSAVFTPHSGTPAVTRTMTIPITGC